MPKVREVSVGLLGCGGVGAALARLIHDEQQAIEEAAGVRLRIGKTLVRDLAKDREGLNGRLDFTKELGDVLKQKKLDIVVELLGGRDVALQAVRRALSSGTSVVTANKVVLAAHGERLEALAHAKGCALGYEASVASCIPVLQALDHTFAAERFYSITAILNGTTNFILTRMAREGLDYEVALRLAQKRGLAEADPTADVSGSDAQCKLVVLARKAFGLSLRPSDVYTRGITSLTADDLRFASSFGFTIKLLATARRYNGSVELRVEPNLVPERHPLATVSDEWNALMLAGDSVGSLFFAGPGAGPLPTAQAVLGDILSIATGTRACVPGRRVLDLERPHIVPLGDTSGRYYLRVTFRDQPHVLASVTRILDTSGVEVHRVEAVGQDRADIAILTHRSRRSSLETALKRLRKQTYLSEPPRAFPIYDPSDQTTGGSK